MTTNRDLASNIEHRSMYLTVTKKKTLQCGTDLEFVSEVDLPVVPLAVLWFTSQRIHPNHEVRFSSRSEPKHACSQWDLTTSGPE